MVKISFLIPVYNQSEDLKRCIASIVQYKNDDIEVVVSDDCSTENLQEIVDSFADKRIHLFRNDENIGLDGNMLFGFSRCKGEFIFILRTRDYVISNAIPHILKRIDENKDVVCISGTCLDEDGLPRLYFKEKLYQKGIDSIEAHYKLQFHPSGVAFKRKCVDCDQIRKYMNSFINTRIWFMADQLIRLYLSTIGDFYLLSTPIWIYTNTERNKKKSVHKKMNESIYSSRMTFNRYKSEMEFINDEIIGNYRSELFRRCFSFWLKQATWVHLAVTENINLQRHYGVIEDPIDVDDERKKFLQFSDEIEKELDTDIFFPEYKALATNENEKYKTIQKQNRERKRRVIERSQGVVAKLNDSDNCLVDYLKLHKYHRVGIYGMGYVGRMVWQTLQNVEDIKIIYICDKNYLCDIEISSDTVAIAPQEIQKFSIDVLILTPLLSLKDIVSKLPENVNSISIEDCFVN